MDGHRVTRALPAAAFAAALVVATPLAAQVECDEDGPQQAMNACALDAYRAADAELNAVYARLRARMPEEERRELRDVQRAWLVYRDGHCRMEAAGFEGGSMQPLILHGCLAHLTRERTEKLKELESYLPET